MHVYIYIYIYIHTYIHMYIHISLREMGGAPRNLAPRSRFLVWVVKPSGCHCTDGHLTSGAFTGV